MCYKLPIIKSRFLSGTFINRKSLTNFSFRRGSLLSTAIFVYAATSPVNGYFGGSLYARMGGKLWIRQMLVSAFMLPAFVCGTAFLINFIAIYYHASRAIPFGTMVNTLFSASVLH